jgi:hypothetical protein
MLLALVGMSLTAAPSVLAAPSPTPQPTATPQATANPHAGEPWWVPTGLRGMRVSAVVASGDTITVVADGRGYTSMDGGGSFSPVATGLPQAVVPCSITGSGTPAGPPDAEVTAGGDHWSLCAGRVFHATGVSADALAAVDPGSPDLGLGAHLIAAPASARGVVVAIATDNSVWRRTGDGTWNKGLVLLPQTLLQSAPAVTGVTAFDQPLTDTVYLATDGYSVLITRDGGDDWVRAGPGLPDSVLALTSDSAAQAVYAGTGDGLWVHHLQPVPGPPVYRPEDLTGRQWGTALVTLLGSLVALGLLRRLVGASPP